MGLLEVPLGVFRPAESVFDHPEAVRTSENRFYSILWSKMAYFGAKSAQNRPKKQVFLDFLGQKPKIWPYKKLVIWKSWFYNLKKLIDKFRTKIRGTYVAATFFLVCFFL